MNMMHQAPQALALSPLTHAGAAMRWRNEAMRSHPTGRLILISKGQGRITVAGLTNGYSPNNLIYLPPQTMYGIEVGPTTHGQILTLPDHTDWPAQPVHLRLLDVWLQKEAVQYVEQIEKELQPAGNPKAADHWLGLLAIFVGRQARAQIATPNDSRRDSAAAKLVARYTHLIARDYRLDRSVASYAAELGVTPTHLARSCQQVAQRSPLALLHDRIHYEACVLLRDTQIPIKDIAALLGFQSAAYFTRSFQEKAGQTPSSFRRSSARLPTR
ncbi:MULTISPECIES: helix-turn-helix transcriptional regulator [unclassified Yoonia]|uniref:helix-turn-helix transcriptional regulator n=1 Tax=unclassified Yoonia TaxID=2629118 RepID=UPI002AFDF07F|nr:MULTISPECIES: helix-turn-helix transcriptional regulator [unclassified Yoonia]